MKILRWGVVIVIVAILVGAGAWLVWVKFEWEKPTLQMKPDSNFVGQRLSFTVEDQKSGVAEVRLEMVQEGKTIGLFSERFPKGTRRVEKNLNMRPLPQGIREGVARIRLSARDHSWNRGNPVILERILTIDTHPPILTILGGIHYGNQGGAALITYQTSEETPLNGVQVGDAFFAGHPAGQNGYLAYYPIPHDAPANLSTSVIAEDRAGNRTQSSFRLVVKPKAFKTDKIQLNEGFLKSILPYFTTQNADLKGSPLDIYLYLNRQQRETDHKMIAKLCQTTADRPLWSGVFLRLPNAKPMAAFAQDRTYWYEDKEIDRQLHLGVDLASLAQSPVPAANAGRVVFAGPLGIYGNTVLIDHGCGLFSMYSHLSQIGSEVNKEVKKGDPLGRTGSTGMAGGDHLHFSMLVNGVFVNPIEWWDEHWIQDNIEKKMKLLSGASLPENPQDRVAELEKAKEPQKANVKKPSRKKVGLRRHI